jgi:hypothetical protein
VRLSAGPNFFEAAGEKNVIEGERDADDDGKKKDKAGQAKAPKRRRRSLPVEALLGQFEIDQPEELIGIARFGLAVTAGIHRERILTIRLKHKWILHN